MSEANGRFFLFRIASVSDNICVDSEEDPFTPILVNDFFFFDPGLDEEYDNFDRLADECLLVIELLFLSCS